MRDSRAEDGLRAVFNSPRPMTFRWTVGDALLSMSAALSSTLLSLMKSSTSKELLAPPNAGLERASLIRARRAADGFLAVPKPPRASTFRCISAEQFLKSSAARSSMSLSLTKSSSSSSVGSVMPLDDSVRSTRDTAVHDHHAQRMSVLSLLRTDRN